MLLNELSGRDKDVLAGILSVGCSLIGGASFTAAGDVFNRGWYNYWISFLVAGIVFVCIGIAITFKQIKRSNAQQQEFENRITYQRIENLQLHLDALKLILNTNKQKNGNVAVLSYYESIFSKIHLASQEIEAELTKENSNEKHT